ncbi:MAG: GGDEF domain-containing protein [Gammaproteobacteria bacterium]|nr:MAG: GGDEF domain-containing protein [Gammaproteobacteria bacterium]
MKNLFKLKQNIFSKLSFVGEIDVDQLELKGFSRSFAELEWLILVLVLVYTVAPGAIIEDQWILLKYSLCFAAFVLAFRYMNFYQTETRWKLAIEVWVMTAYITCVLWYTGKVDSPLLNLYLLVIITSGMTLGKITTLLVLTLIASLYLMMGVATLASGPITLELFSHMMTVFSPYLIIAYLTTMLSADLQFSKMMFKHLSETDEMTGLMNRRSFTEIITSEHNKSVRYKHAYAILMIDADGLKMINDEYGHEAGDKMITTLAKTLESCMRETDSLARYGGDEFVVLLPETGKFQAEDAGERMRKAVANTSFDMGGNLIKATVSIGVSSYPEDADNAEGALNMADKALYNSKREGRNQVRTSVKSDEAG